MTVLLGQLLGLSFACGLNLYLTVAALGLLARLGVVRLPAGLGGLEGIIVIGSAVSLYVVEAVVDKIRHADSLWDTVHTLVRPPAAALLAVALTWGRPLPLVLAATAAAFLVALIAHGTKAGARIALHTRTTRGHRWISLGEDLLALLLAAGAFIAPRSTLYAAAVVLLLVLLLGPGYWRAFRLGVRSLGAWLRTLFRPARWREADEIPRHVRRALGAAPVGTAPPRAARAAVHGLARVGAYRNGWIVVHPGGPSFVYRTILGTRQAGLPVPDHASVDSGPWVDIIRVRSDPPGDYQIYLLKDGPGPDLTLPQLQHPLP